MSPSPFQRFLHELRRRHVPQTAAVYAVAAWAAIQFADLVAPNLGWPQWVVTAVIITSAVGFPVVLVAIGSAVAVAVVLQSAGEEEAAGIEAGDSLLFEGWFRPEPGRAGVMRRLEITLVTATGETRTRSFNYLTVPASRPRSREPRGPGSPGAPGGPP